MQPQTTKDISWMMRGYIPAAALGTAMELGLFWILDDEPQEVHEVANLLGIPLQRCHYWLEYLFELGLLKKDQGDYFPSKIARESILDTRSQATWAFLAGEAKERLPGVFDLSLHIGEPGSVWEATGYNPPDYLANLRADPENASRFTRMLYELHQEEAEQLAEMLNMAGVKKLLDIGGGSGVMSLALLRRNPHLEAVVVDQANVVATGREIAIENSLEKRISYYEANFLVDDISQGFDMIIECDVGIYNRSLFRKIFNALNPEGRFVILDYSFETEDADRMNLMSWGFFSSLRNPEFKYETAEEIMAIMKESGFLTPSKPRPLMEGLVIEAIKGGY